jgi:hypothetical protein
MNVQKSGATSSQTKVAPVAPNPTRAAEAAKATKPAKEAKEPKVDPVLAKKIKVITDGAKNPKREGSKSHARFALYANTGKQTAGEYVELSVSKGQSRRAARADLTWDVEHKFIELID